MRFIVKEQPYEKPIAAGLLRYVVDGRPTGAVEEWRLTQATEGYELLRVDLDARAATTGRSYLFHLVRQTNGAPQRLGYRFWGDGLQIAGTLLFDETSITGTHAVNGVTHTADMDIPPGTPFWFPSTIGLGLAVRGGSGTAVALSNQVDGAHTLALQTVEMNVQRTITDTKEVEVAGKKVAIVPYTIRWGDHLRAVSCDLHGWPVQMQRAAPPDSDGDTLTAHETRHIWYRR